MKKFGHKIVEGYAIYCVNDTTGELAVNALDDFEIGLTHEELKSINSVLFDNEANIRAKLRGIKIDTYDSHFTVLREEAFMSKKRRTTETENSSENRPYASYIKYIDKSPNKEIISTMTLVEQAKTTDDSDRQREANNDYTGRPRQVFSVAQCGNIFVVTRCTKIHGLHMLSSVSCNIA